MSASRLLALLSVLLLTTSACRKAEFRCRNGRCIPQNLYCDGADDCADKSDEPPHCSPCNRTYYGEEGRTYGLELRQPRRDHLPHICQLNFIADGKSYGDLLELVFDTFSLGRFTSHVHNGCPDGHMQIVEVGQIHNDGFWCGNAYGYNVYYSETGNVRVTFRLYRLSEGGNFGVDEASQFYIKLRYKFVSRARAVMRLGNKGAKFLGIVVHKSFCDFMFDRCDRDRCRIQSPNFPGMYPRNVTCSYHITHSAPPPGTRALLVLSQKYGELINIKASDGSSGGSRELRTWSKCDVVRDFVTVFDGVTKSSPKLLKFCSGAELPPLISSGPNMIVEFRTSAFDRLTQPTFSADKLKYPTSYMPGFELEVSVQFVNITDRTKYVDSGGCNYMFSSTSRTRGMIYSPAHSLPSNTTCRYTLLGRSHERLWIYFLRYHVTYHAGYDKGYGSGAKSRHCHHRLDITDGAPGDGANRSLGFFCGDTKPRLCSRAMQAQTGAAVPPCGPEESYLSQAENVTLLQRHVTGLGLDTVSFQLRYEFVDMREDGQQLGDEPCHRVFASRGRLSKGTFGPARNVFLYGRGGRQHLRCLFRFEGTSGERVRILVNKFTAADESGCETVYDEGLGRYQCRYHGRARTELRLAEVPWPGVRVWRDCVCADRRTGEPVVVESTASVLELQYDVFNMTADEDFYSYSFIAKYEFLRKTACKMETRINGSSGVLALERSSAEPDDTCDLLPWLLEAAPGAHLYLSVAGRRQAPGVCQSPTRLVVLAPDRTDPLAVICPGGTDMVEVFSADWHHTTHRSAPPADHQRHLVLDVVKSVPGQPVKVTWLELRRPEVRRASSAGVQGRGHSEAWSSEPCLHMCPELDGGCIAAELWCDNVRHCPSGRDEAPEICHRWSIPWLYVGVAGSAALTIMLLCVAALVHRRQKEARRDGARCNAAIATNPLQKRPPTDETLTTSGLYSGSSSLKNGKDLISVPSTYSMDSGDVDLVETTV